MRGKPPARASPRSPLRKREGTSAPPAALRLLERLSQPPDELLVDLAILRDPDAVRHHRVEAPRRLQSGGGLGALEVDPDVEPRCRGRLDQGELLAPPQADVRLLGRDF